MRMGIHQEEVREILLGDLFDKLLMVFCATTINQNNVLSTLENGNITGVKFFSVEKNQLPFSKLIFLNNLLVLLQKIRLQPAGKAARQSIRVGRHWLLLELPIIAGVGMNMMSSHWNRSPV